MDLALNWRPSASREALKKRADLMAKIRAFFVERDYLEVETPALSQYGITDVYLANIRATFREKTYYLQTSPEYHMKRLLAAGSGPVFQIARVFRDDELGRWHNPEFSLLEWYQLGIDHHALMDEVDCLLQQILGCQPMVRKTYRDAFMEIANLDPFDASINDFKALLARHDLENVLAVDEQDCDQYLFLLMSHLIEPALASSPVPVAVYHFPPSQASLAQIKDGHAERFEVYYKGVELANGFHELTDVTQQASRFEDDRHKRHEAGLAEAMPDVNFLAALAHGLPPCSGVALGLDRLIALALDQTSIAATLAFEFSRA